MTAEDYQYLLPKPDEQTSGFWEGARRHEVVIQECSECGVLRHPPQAPCIECGSEKSGWRTTSGRGTLYSYVIVHRATLSQWRDSGPYNVALIELEDAPGIRLHGNVVGIENEDLHVGMQLEATFDDVTAEDTIIRWFAPQSE